MQHCNLTNYLVSPSQNKLLASMKIQPPSLNPINVMRRSNDPVA
jgi:hypothetical protein